MSISKDLVITITNEVEGTNLVLKTVSSLGKDKIAISGDPGIYNLQDIQDALAQVRMFNHDPILVQLSSGVKLQNNLNDLDDGTNGVHIP